jgi:hypothetical protein
MTSQNRRQFDTNTLLMTIIQTPIAYQLLHPQN